MLREQPKGLKRSSLSCQVTTAQLSALLSSLNLQSIPVSRIMGCLICMHAGRSQPCSPRTVLPLFLPHESAIDQSAQVNESTTPLVKIQFLLICGLPKNLVQKHFKPHACSVQDVLRRGTLLTPVETKWALELIGLDTKAIPVDDTVAGLTISRFTTELTWANLNELRPRQFEHPYSLRGLRA